MNRKQRRRAVKRRRKLLHQLDYYDAVTARTTKLHMLAERAHEVAYHEHDLQTLVQLEKRTRERLENLDRALAKPTDRPFRANKRGD